MRKIIKRIFKYSFRPVQDMICKPGTYRLSMARIVFLLIIGVCIFTTITKGVLLGPWVTLAMTLLPYMYLDKKIHEKHRDNDAGESIPDLLPDTAAPKESKTDNEEEDAEP